MEGNELAFFESIQEQKELDKLVWRRAQEEDSIPLSDAKEDEMMERAFLVSIGEQYLESQIRIKELEQQLSEMKNDRDNVRGILYRTVSS